MRPLSLCRAASDLHGNGYACPCCRPSFFSASLSFSFSIIHLTHFFFSTQFLFSMTLSSATINCLPPFCSPLCLTLSWFLTSPFVVNCAPSSSSQTTFFPSPLSKRMQVSSMYEHCVRMKLLSQRFCMLKVTQEEFLCMKALVLFSISESLWDSVWNNCHVSKWNMTTIVQPYFGGLLLCSGFVVTVPFEGLKSQRCFDELRSSYIKELDRLASHQGETTRTQRMFQLTQLLDSLQSVTETVPPYIWNHTMMGLY